MRPLAIDLCSGLGGWAEGLEAEGWDVIRVDIADMFAETRRPKPDPCLLMVQDILTFHGSQARNADLIVASPPCQAYSYMAMPWSRAKAQAAAIRADTTGQALADLNALFDACFRIQREACAAAGRHIPMVVENVRGAQPWVGRARWNFGSFYLWGDLPALMPQTMRAQKFNPDGTAHGQGSWFAIADSKERGARKNTGGSWFNIGGPGQEGQPANNPDGRKLPGFRFDGSGGSFQTASVEASGQKVGHDWFGRGEDCSPMRHHAHASPRRKEASALIAKIPEALSRFIARTYLPQAIAA